MGLKVQSCRERLGLSSADYFKLFQGRRMDELFTFNSRQLQNITNHPKIIAQSPKYRKRILSAKLSKKLIRASSPAEDSRDNYTDRTPAKRIKKVTFNIPSPSACLKRSSAENDELSRQPRSVFLLKNKISSESNPKTQKMNENTNESTNLVRKLVKRAFSTVERNGGGQIEECISDHKNEVSMPERRERRINSVKGSPKVMIPLNNKKLPDVFKMKLGEKRIIKDKKLQHRIVEEHVSSNMSFPSWLDQHISVPLSGLDRWKNVVNLESKLFSRLYAHN